MDIEKRLEAEHSKTLTTAIVQYIGSDRKKFGVLMDIFLGNEFRLTQRAAWPLSYVSAEQPQLVKPYLKKMVKKLHEPHHHPAVARNILRIFQDINIPEDLGGELIDLCFEFIMNETKPVAIRAFALTTAANICEPYPELKKELAIILNELQQMPQKPAMKHRIKVALKKLHLFIPKL